MAVQAFEETSLSSGDFDAIYVGKLMGDLIEDRGRMGAFSADHIGAREADSVGIERSC